MKLIYLESAEVDSLDISFGFKILFFRVSVTIEPNRLLTAPCLENYIKKTSFFN